MILEKSWWSCLVVAIVIAVVVAVIIANCHWCTLCCIPTNRQIYPIFEGLASILCGSSGTMAPLDYFYIDTDTVDLPSLLKSVAAVPALQRRKGEGEGSS